MSLSRGLVGHWSLDEESYNPATKRFTDNAGYANHGTSAKAASFVADRMGQGNRAAEFNGSSDYVNCGNGDSLDITGAITLAAWVKTASAYVSQKCIVSKLDPSDGYCMDIKNEKLRGFLQLGGGQSPVLKSITSINDQKWHHCVFTDNDTVIKLFVDNIEEDSDIKGLASTGTTPIRLWIGQFDYWSGGGFYFQGSIDNVRIYNRVLTEEEITLLYESYRPKTIIA